MLLGFFVFYEGNPCRDCAWEHVSHDFCFNRFMVLKETVEKACRHPACVVHACVWKLGPKNRTPPDVEETYVYILSYHIYTYIYFFKKMVGAEVSIALARLSA